MIHTTPAEPSAAKGVDSPLDRVLRALNHPVRRQILRSLVDRNGSASAISKELEMELGVVSYHLNQVLAKECGVVELVAAIPKRGALEKIYKLKFDSLQGGTGSSRLEEAGAGVRTMSLEESFIVAVAAMDADPFDQLSGSGWEWALAQVDSEAWQEICDARDDFSRRAIAAIQESQERAAGDDSHDVVMGIAAFPAASPRASSAAPS